MKYAVSMQFWDPQAPSGIPQNLFVKITGKDASKIYEFGGTKNFTVSSVGILTLGLDPFVMPTTSAPISFNVEVWGPDYMTTKIPVTIDGAQKQQLIAVTMVNTKNPPAGVSVKQTEVPVASDGSVTTDVTLATPTNSSTPEASVITIPNGTRFKNAAGQFISSNGTALVVNQVYYGTRSAVSLSAFPQNSFVSDSIYVNGTRQSGYFQTAGFTSIEMSLNGQDIKTFSDDITVTMDIDPTFINPETNAPVQAGETVSIYSYEVGANRWTYEKDATVQNVGGTLKLAFETNHLTYYSAGWMGAQCSNGINVTFNTNQNVTTSYLLDIYAKDGDPRQPIIPGLYVTVANGETITLTDMPQGDIIIKVYPNNENNSQFYWNIRDAQPLGIYDNNACGASNITLNVAQAQNFAPTVFNIVGLCPGNVLVYPTVPTYYRKNGTNAPYTLLGQVVLGQFTTTNLQLGQKYDFLWLWKGRNLKLSRVVDSSSYTRVKPVVDRFPGDTLVDLFCY